MVEKSETQPEVVEELKEVKEKTAPKKKPAKKKPAKKKVSKEKEIAKEDKGNDLLLS